MNRLLLKSAMTIAAAIVLYSTSLAAQLTPGSRKAAHIRITQGPELEVTKYDMAIITGTSNNPGGSPEHYGVVHYGIDPKNLSTTGKSHMRLNPGHSYTVLVVSLDNAK